MLMLRTLLHSCADCYEIWEPQTPGIVRACPGLQLGLLYLLLYPIRFQEIFLRWILGKWGKYSTRTLALLDDIRDRFPLLLHALYILIIKTNEMHYFSYLFDKVLYIFRTVPLSIIRSISTLYTRNRHLSC
jgi:hypothetical protein